MKRTFQRLVSQGHLLPDPAQQTAVEGLDLLQQLLLGTRAANVALQQNQTQTQGPAHVPGGPAHAHPGIVGVYLWGSVGGGKTMLMDMLVDTMSDAGSASLDPTPLTCRRLHYHEFMMGVHSRLHELELELPRVVSRSRLGLPVFRQAAPTEDPVHRVGREIAASASLLCLDELHVADVADAMLLARLFATIVAQGSACAFTSNRAPQDLYKGGLNRQYFMPFVRMLEQRFAVIHLRSARDYRLRTPAPVAAATAGQGTGEQGPRGPMPARPDPVGAAPAAGLQEGPEDAPRDGPMTPGSPPVQPPRDHSSIARLRTVPRGAMHVGTGAAGQLRSTWQQLAGSAGAVEGHVHVGFGRTLWVPLAVQEADPQAGLSCPLPAAYFTFQQLCGRQGLRRAVDEGGALAAPDFLAIARGFPTLFLEGLPQLDGSTRDEARRLVTLVDVLYEAGTTLYCAAGCEPHALFLPLLAAAKQMGVNPNLGRHEKLAAADLQRVAPSLPAAEPSRRGASAAEERSSPALVAEEVLMYHRAASRLQEMCQTFATHVTSLGT